MEDCYKPLTYRRKSEEELAGLFKKANSSLRNILKPYSDVDFILEEGGNDNKIGSDLVMRKKDTGEKLYNIELKFGEETARNIGNNTMEKVFKIEDKNVSFSSLFQSIAFFQKEFVKENALLPENEKEVLGNLESLLSLRVEKLNSLLQSGKLKIDSKAMRELMCTTGAMENFDEAELIKVKVLYSKDAKNSMHVIDIPSSDSPWEVKHITMSPKSKRVEIVAKNEKAEAKFLLNWKNNYRFNQYNKAKYPAKFGLGTSNWNVWVNSIEGNEYDQKS